MTPDLERKLYLDGVTLFNEGSFFAAHEVWEDVWRATPPTDEPSRIKREFYQGLIQCAVALEHYRRSNPRGVRSLYDSYRRHFAAGVPDRYLGLDVRTFLAAMRQALAPVLDADPVPEKGTVTLDPARAPRIQLVE